MRAVNVTARDRANLVTLAAGGSLGSGDFNRLCDLGLTGYEARTRLRGTTCSRSEHVWIKAAGRELLAAGQDGV